MFDSLTLYYFYSKIQEKFGYFGYCFIGL